MLTRMSLSRRLGVLGLIACGIGSSILATGCALLHPRERQAVIWADNPLSVTSSDREYLWNQIVDTVDDYFPIQREERIRQSNGILTEGRIETRATVGATVLEPWRRDSTPGFELRHASLQSIRRRAIVRIWPSNEGYQIEVTVLKELEEVDRPEFSSGGGVVFRHDGTLVRHNEVTDDRPHTLSWIPLGRDLSLEQQILAELKARLDQQTDLSIPLPTPSMAPASRFQSRISTPSPIR